MNLAASASCRSAEELRDYEQPDPPSRLRCPRCGAFLPSQHTRETAMPDFYAVYWRCSRCKQETEGDRL